VLAGAAKTNRSVTDRIKVPGMSPWPSRQKKQALSICVVASTAGRNLSATERTRDFDLVMVIVEMAPLLQLRATELSGPALTTQVSDVRYGIAAFDIRIPWRARHPVVGKPYHGRNGES